LPLILKIIYNNKKKSGLNFQIKRLLMNNLRWQRKQVCGSEGTVVGWAGTLLLCALAVILFCLFIGLVSLLHGRSSACA